MAKIGKFLAILYKDMSTITRQRSSTNQWFIWAAIFMAVVICLLGTGMVFILYTFPMGIIRIVTPTAVQPLVVFDPNPEPSLTPFLPMPTPIATPTPTPTPAPTPTLIPTPLPTSIPQSTFISGVPSNPQIYSLDCEARSAVDWAAFFGTRINEQQFINQLPKSDDPETGFVGNINGYLGQFPPKSYGVHAPPVAALLRAFGAKAQAIKGFTWEELKAEILSGRPVIAWIVNYPYKIETRSYKASNGNTTTVARFEHTWIVNGFDTYSVRVVDSQWTYKIDVSEFLTRWAALGNMVIVFR